MQIHHPGDPNLINALRAVMAAEGIVTDDSMIADGKLRRVHVGGDRKGTRNGWYKLHADGVPAGAFGSWRFGITKTWRLSTAPVEADAAAKQRLDQTKQREEDDGRLHERARAKAAKIWEHAKPAPADHPYLVSKQVRPHDLRISCGSLVVPVRDHEGVLQSVQFIRRDGTKRFLAGGRVGGCFHLISRPKTKLFIAEGWATAATVHEAIGEAVAIAFDAANLVPVAKALRRKFGCLELVVCSDDDYRTQGNPGQRKASEAAQALGTRVAVAIPRFPNAQSRGTDFNDLARLEGLEAVRHQLAAAKKPWPQREANPWDAAKDMTEFLTQEDTQVEFFEPRLLAREFVTEFFSPRGVCKSEVASHLAVKHARNGLRVLYLDRDNPRRHSNARFRAWGAEGLKTLKALSREKVPPLTNVKAWSVFPYRDYDLVIIDSFDSHAEGVGEQDSARPSRAIAPLLDIAHREGGPAVLVLGNTVRSGKHSRGSGVVEDRADIIYEVRDITGWTPSGNKDWWEELPPASAADWASRASRKKKRPEKVSAAFICTKLRGEEPEPFGLEIDFTKEPRALREITDEIDKAGTEARETRRRDLQQKLDLATKALVAELARREKAGEPPLHKDRGAVPFLSAIGLGRNQARELLKRWAGKEWVFRPLEGERGNPLGVFAAENPDMERNSGANQATTGHAKTLGTKDLHLRHQHEQAPAVIPFHETPVSSGSDAVGDLRYSTNLFKPVEPEIEAASDDNAEELL
jgi:phage/plasmid primase-like uncharacterized protein